MKKQKEQAIKITKTHYMDLVDKIWKALDGDPIRNREDYWKRLNSDHPHVGKSSIFTLSEMIEKAINQIKWEVEKNKNKIDNFSDMVIVNKELVLHNQELRSINAKLTKENEEIKKDIEAKIASHIKNLIMKEFNPTVEAEQAKIKTIADLYDVRKRIEEAKEYNFKSTEKKYIYIKEWDKFESSLHHENTINKGSVSEVFIDRIDGVQIYTNREDYTKIMNDLKKLNEVE